MNEAMNVYEFFSLLTLRQPLGSLFGVAGRFFVNDPLQHAK